MLKTHETNVFSLQIIMLSMIFQFRYIKQMKFSDYQQAIIISYIYPTLIMKLVN